MTNDTYRLDGLEPDNLLAFLALIGTLRALERARPTWNVRVRWDGPPMRPEVRLSVRISREELLNAVRAGVADFARHLEFDGYIDLKLPADVCRNMLEKVSTLENRDREILYAALMSDAATKKDDSIATPPLCTMLGQGHQHFLQRLVTVGRAIGGDGAGRKKPVSDLGNVRYFESALFDVWARDDATDSFRWDPAEDRRYATRELNPSDDPVRTEHGANRLAVAGLPLLMSLPTGRGGSAAITTIGFSRGSDRRRRITWPIWTRFLDLHTILSLLFRPDLHSESPAFANLASLGVVAAYRAYRVENGYFASFTLAELFSV